MRPAHRPGASRGASTLAVGRTARAGLLAGGLALVASACRTPDADEPPADAAPSEPSFAPVLRADFPDPFILALDGELLAYATNRPGANVPMASSTDLVTWRAVQDERRPGEPRDALPELPAWAGPGWTWAPEVLETADGFVLYFTARHVASDRQCVGAATSEDPRGPFTSAAAEPLVCQLDLGGTIDASPFRGADGQLYLLYKNDGNHPDVDVPAEIFSQRLAADGLALVGDAVSLVRNDAPWEGRVVEAPTMVERDGAHVLFFSANDYGWQAAQAVSAYSTGYATCEGPLGPCTDAPTNPLLASTTDPCLSGPGHQTVFQSGGVDYLGFHAWAATPSCRPADRGRFLHLGQLSWEDGAPRVSPLDPDRAATAR